MLSVLEECSLKSLSIAKSGSGTSETWFDNTAAGTAYAQPILLNWMHDRYRVFWGGQLLARKIIYSCCIHFLNSPQRDQWNQCGRIPAIHSKKKKKPINNKTKITNEMGRTGH